MADLVGLLTAEPLALLVGQRWSAAIVAALAGGPARFGALRDAVPGISANVLAARLGALGAAGVLKRIELPAPASTPAYALTPWGGSLVPILAGLGDWASGLDAKRPPWRAAVTSKSPPGTLP